MGDRGCTCEITDIWGRQQFSCLVISAVFISTILSLTVIQRSLWALLLLLLTSCFKLWNPLLSSVRCLQLGDLAAQLPFLGVRLLQHKGAEQLGATLLGHLCLTHWNSLPHLLLLLCFFSFFCLPSWCLCLHCSHGFVLCWFSFFLSISLFCGGFCFFCSVFYTALHHYAVQKHFSSRKQFDFLPKSLRACWSVSLWIFSKGRWQVTFWGFEERGLHADWLQSDLSSFLRKLLSVVSIFLWWDVGVFSQVMLAGFSWVGGRRYWWELCRVLRVKGLELLPVWCRKLMPDKNTSAGCLAAKLEVLPFAACPLKSSDSCLFENFLYLTERSLNWLN